MFLTLRQAAEQSGVDKSTIQRAIKNGRMSADKDNRNHYQIDPAELDRVFPARVSKPSHGTGGDVSRETPRNTQKSTDETPVLLAENEMLREIAADRQRTIEDLRRRLDKAEDDRNKEAEERRQLTIRLLEYQKPEQKPKKWGLFSK